MNKILIGDCLQVLRTLETESIQCCITSPPYWGLRDYGVDGQIGLEKTPQEYVDKIVAVFAELKRVSKEDGTLWLNLGDSYYNYRPGPEAQCKQSLANHNGAIVKESGKRGLKQDGLKEKDLCGIPWMVAFALRADGWYLRQDIIWAKPNPMPESVRDRCTKSHEYIFLLSKSAKYYYNADSIKEKSVGTEYDKTMRPQNRMANARYLKEGKGQEKVGANLGNGTETRNKRSVWTITTKSYSEAHFATFPPEIPKLCMLAASRPGDTVLDPFSGSGTTGAVAADLGRNYIGIELNPKYAEMRQEERNVLALEI